MKNTISNNNQPVVENVVAGIVGAFLGALAGGVVYFLFYLIGIVSALAGVVGVVLAIKGYSWLSKKETIKGIIISAVIALLVIVLAWYLCFAFDIHQAYKEWYAAGEVDIIPSLAQCVSIVPVFLSDPEIASGYLINLALGVLFAIIGGVGYIITAVKRVKAQKAYEANVAAYSNPEQYQQPAQSCDPFIPNEIAEDNSNNNTAEQ